MISGLASTLTVAAFSLGLVLSNSKVIDANIQKGDSNVVYLTLAVHTGEKDTWDRLAEKFRQTPGNENIYLQIDQIDKDFKEEAKKRDLVYTDIIWLPEFVDDNIIMPINEELIQKFGVKNVKELVEKTGFLKTEIEHGQYPPKGKSKLYRIPFRTDMGVLYYRKDLLRQYNRRVPKTYDELIAVAQEIQTKEKKNDERFFGYLWQDKGEGAATMFLEVLRGHGGFWVEDSEPNLTKKVGLANQEAISAIKFLRETLRKNISPVNYRTENGAPISQTFENDEKETDSLFKRGRAVFLRSWPNVWNKAENDSESEVKRTIGIIPMVGNKPKARTSCQGGWGLALNKSLENNPTTRDAAIKAIVYLTSKNSQKQFTLEQGTLPTIKSLFRDPAVTRKYPHYEDLYEDFIDGNKLVPRPRTVKYEQLSEILQNTLKSALDLQKSNLMVDKIMRDSARLTRECLRPEVKVGGCTTTSRLIKP
jgi:multiple sugar transport system substrate-binding protein